MNENYFPTLEINTEAFHSLSAIISRAVKIAAVERKPLAESNIKRRADQRTDQRTDNRKDTARKLREQQQVPLVESQTFGQSPQKPGYSPYKSRLKAKPSSRYDGEYENLTRKVAEMRQENERLSRYLNEQWNLIIWSGKEAWRTGSSLAQASSLAIFSHYS